MLDYVLMDGTRIPKHTLSTLELNFLRSVERMGRHRVPYEKIERAVFGPGSVALGGAHKFSLLALKLPVYLVARDIATRIGIEQGVVASPETEEALAREEREHGPLVSVAQAAKKLTVTPAAIYKAIDQGRLESVRIGKLILVRAASVTAFAKKRRQRAA